jgi:hypothetical protein
MPIDWPVLPQTCAANRALISRPRDHVVVTAGVAPVIE